MGIMFWGSVGLARGTLIGGSSLPFQIYCKFGGSLVEGKVSAELQAGGTRDFPDVHVEWWLLQ